MNEEKSHSQQAKDSPPDFADQRKPAKLDNERIRQILLQDEERLQKHLQPLFYAMLRGAPVEAQDRQTQVREREKGNEIEQSQQRFSTSNNEESGVTKPTERSTKTPAPPLSTPRVPIDDYIPYDPNEISKTPIFKQLYHQIQFQRDQYLVGTEYATWRVRERQAERRENSSGGAVVVQVDPNDHLPHDLTALGHKQLAQVAADFIPTKTVRDALCPLLVPLPTDTLYPPLRSACISAILGQQANLNHIAQQSLITFLKNPQNRMAIKKSTYGFLDTNYNDTTAQGEFFG